MANIKSKIKRIKTNEKSREANAAFKSSVKTAIRKFKEASAENSTTLYNEAVALIDKGVAKGIYHKNYGARKVSQLALAKNKK